MPVTMDPSVSSASVKDQQQVAVLRQSQNLEKQQGEAALNLIKSAVPSVNASHEGRNVNIVV